MGVRDPLMQFAAPMAPAVGELVGLLEDGTALLLSAGPDQDAVRKARSTVDLHAQHIGAHCLVLHENNDPSLPIIVGVLRRGTGWPLATAPGGVELTADGSRLIVSATEQLVLRCGSARLTLTRDGKVLIEGKHVSSSATGANRIKGGSIHLN